MDEGLEKSLLKIERKFEAQIERINLKRSEYIHNSFGILNEDEANEFIRAVELAKRKAESY